MAPPQTDSSTAAPAPAHLRAANPEIQTAQPIALRPMDPQRAHPESQDQELGLRGGRSEACPGRFCFCVPCPIPCDFCII
ncbi:hypothetical protein GQ53DRAFT_816297 [Thozetella sp. PMI_491]|nr:hypothetical protein GQ53DRAFT_816297 [Thozetella sp. PMI_491]